MSTSPAHPPLPTGAARGTVVGTVLFAAFVYTLSAKGTVLQTEQIIQAFHLDRYRVQWITGSEGVVGLTAIFAAIHLTNVFGARRMFLVGAVCLGLGAAGTALARTPWQFGVAGVVRSCAALFAIPGLVVLMRLMPRRKGVIYCSYLAMIYGGQVLAEPLGSLLEFHPSWRALFVVIAACAAWSVLCALFLFPDDRPARGPEVPFAWPGMFLFAAMLGLVFFLLYRGNYLGWLVSTRIQLALAALAVVVALFAWRELVAPEPFIGLGVFAYRTAAVTLLAAACWSASLYGVAILLPQFLLLRGYQHWKTGWVILPMGLVLLATMVLGGFVRERVRHVWMLRLGLAGMAALSFWLARIDLYTPWQRLTAVTVAWGFCAGLCLPAIARLTYEGQLPEQAAATGAMKFFLRAFGATLGVLVGGVLFDRATAWGQDFVGDSITLGQGALQVTEPAMRDYMARHGSSPPEAAARADALLGHWVGLHAQVIGCRAALRFAAWLSAVGMVISCFVSRRKEISAFDSDD
jgi:MFS family permease